MLEKSSQIHPNNHKDYLWYHQQHWGLRRCQYDVSAHQGSMNAMVEPQPSY